MRTIIDGFEKDKDESLIVDVTSSKEYGEAPREYIAFVIGRQVTRISVKDGQKLARLLA